jgi:hypothetical protein
LLAIRVLEKEIEPDRGSKLGGCHGSSFTRDSPAGNWACILSETISRPVER